MRNFLALLFAISLLASLGTCTVSKGAVHEIEALIWLLIGTIALVGYAILGAIERSSKAPPPAK